MGMTCLFVALILGIICGFAGYFIGKSNTKSFQNEGFNYKSDLDACNQRNSQLQNDIDTLRIQLKQNSKPNSAPPIEPLVSTSIISPFNEANAKAAFGKKIKENDLKIIEGVGTKN